MEIKDKLSDLELEEFKKILKFILVVRRAGLSDDCRRVMITLIFHARDPLTNNETKNTYGLTKFDIMRATSTKNRKAEEDALKFLVERGLIEKSNHVIDKVPMTLYKLGVRPIQEQETIIPGISEFYNMDFIKLFSATVAYTKFAGLSDAERSVIFLLHINKEDDMYNAYRVGKCGGIDMWGICDILLISRVRANLAIKELIAKKLIKKCPGDSKEFGPSYIVVDGWQEILDKNMRPDVTMGALQAMMDKRPSIML